VTIFDRAAMRTIELANGSLTVVQPRGISGCRSRPSSTAGVQKLEIMSAASAC
jgi:hypothetical protein